VAGRRDKAGGFEVSEVAGADMRAVGVGLSMEQVQVIGRDVVAREQVGAQPVDKPVVAFIGLSQFI
jgi:hypothetical protein